MEKKLWAIFHGYDIDGGFGDPVPAKDMVGIVEATEEEIAAFVEKYNKPIVYDKPYGSLHCHSVGAKEFTPVSLNDIKPYGEGDHLGKAAKLYELPNIFKDKYGNEWWHDQKIYEEFVKEERRIEEEEV